MSRCVGGAVTRSGILFFFFFFLGRGWVDGYITGAAGPSEGDMMELQDGASAFYSQLGHVPVFTFVLGRTLVRAAFLVPDELRAVDWGGGEAAR